MTTVATDSGLDALDYRRRAEQHRPDDPIVVADAIHRLAAEGLTAADISQALGVEPAHVHQALSSRGEPA